MQGSDLNGESTVSFNDSNTNGSADDGQVLQQNPLLLAAQRAPAGTAGRIATRSHSAPHRAWSSRSNRRFESHLSPSFNPPGDFCPG